MHLLVNIYLCCYAKEILPLGEEKIRNSVIVGIRLIEQVVLFIIVKIGLLYSLSLIESRHSIGVGIMRRDIYFIEI